MARNRIIKPDFWADERISLLSDKAKLLYIGMWNFAEDNGSIRFNPAYLRSVIFIYEDITVKEMIGFLNELDEFLTKYSVNGQDYAIIKNFKKHQVINRPQPSRLPDPPTDSPCSRNNHGMISESYVNNVNENVNGNVNENENEEKTSSTQILKTYGEYENVFLYESDYQKLLCEIAHEPVLKEIINELSQSIAEGSEGYGVLTNQNGNAHFARLRKYWKYRKMNPDKFRKESKPEYKKPEISAPKLPTYDEIRGKQIEEENEIIRRQEEESKNSKKWTVEELKQTYGVKNDS